MSEKLEPNLLPCPHCGGEAIFEWRGSTTDLRIRCIQCSCMTAWYSSGHGGDPTPDWNRRSSRFVTDEMIEIIEWAAIKALNWEGLDHTIRYAKENRTGSEHRWGTAIKAARLALTAALQCSDAGRALLKGGEEPMIDRTIDHEIEP